MAALTRRAVILRLPAFSTARFPSRLCLVGAKTSDPVLSANCRQILKQLGRTDELRHQADGGPGRVSCPGIDRYICRQT